MINTALPGASSTGTHPKDFFLFAVAANVWDDSIKYDVKREIVAGPRMRDPRQRPEKRTDGFEASLVLVRVSFALLDGGVWCGGRCIGTRVYSLTTTI